MKLTENIEASAWKAISVLKTRSLFAPGQQIRLAGAVAIVAMLASAESLSAQPITGTAATKPLDPKELDGSNLRRLVSWEIFIERPTGRFRSFFSLLSDSTSQNCAVAG
jgi:hypothetical protein